MVDHSGIKIPFFAFFAHDNGHRVKEAPLNMLLAMGGAAALCIGLGLYPAPLYKILPYPVDYAPYTVSHVVNSLQLLLFAALAFGILWRTRIYPPEIDAINLDTDWIYRKAAPPVVVAIGRVCAAIHKAVVGTGAQLGKAVLGGLEKTHAPPRGHGRTLGNRRHVPLGSSAARLLSDDLLLIAAVTAPSHSSQRDQGSLSTDTPERPPRRLVRFRRPFRPPGRPDLKFLQKCCTFDD